MLLVATMRNGYSSLLTVHSLLHLVCQHLTASIQLQKTIDYKPLNKKIDAIKTYIVIYYLG